MTRTASSRPEPRHWGAGRTTTERPRPVVGVMCCNQFIEERDAQVVSSRFITPLAQIAGVSVLLIPAIADAVAGLVDRLDGLMLTGSGSNVCSSRYGGASLPDGQKTDGRRDEVALGLAGRMIERGRPVFGICRGVQELNVLFGGTLATDVGTSGHFPADDSLALDVLFSHRHEVEIAAEGLLDSAMPARRLNVISVHRQGIDRLGDGLTAEAHATDGLVEAVSAHPCGGPVLGVQWHPEWDVAYSAPSQAFFQLVGDLIRNGAPLTH
jgi:putative glutamine amidotransferase